MKDSEHGRFETAHLRTDLNFKRSGEGYFSETTQRCWFTWNAARSLPTAVPVVDGGHRTAWLIERGQAMHHAPTLWWCGPGPHDYTDDPNRAMQFAEPAEAQRTLDTQGPHFVASARIAEHVFLSNPHTDVPVVDVEKAAKEFYNPRLTDEQWRLVPTDLRDDSMRRARDILDARYLGSVSVEDVRTVAKAALALFALGDAKEIAPEIAAAKRLLAAVAGKEGR